MKILHDACAFFTLFKKLPYSIIKGTNLFFLHLRSSLLQKMLPSYVMYRARGRRHFGFGGLIDELRRKYMEREMERSTCALIRERNVCMCVYMGLHLLLSIDLSINKYLMPFMNWNHDNIEIVIRWSARRAERI